MFDFLIQVRVIKTREQIRGKYTSNKMTVYLVGEMWSKIRIENRKPKSKIQSGTLLKIEMTHANYILS